MLAKFDGSKLLVLDPASQIPFLTAVALGAALTILLASRLGMPVLTTHVTAGGILGIGLLRRQKADWRLIRTILLSWLVTLPAGALLASMAYVLRTG